MGIANLWSRTVNTAVVLTILLAIAGCASVPIDEPLADPGASADQELIRALEQRTQWSMRASMGIRAEATSTSAAQNVSATMNWSEQPEKLTVVLRGPFGFGGATLTADPSQATLRQGRSTLVDRDPSVLVQRALNLTVPVPLKELSFWMRGLPGTASDLTYDQVGRLQSLRYVDSAGVQWEAIVKRYSEVDGLSVPGLITAQGGPYNVRLVIKNWRLDL